MSDNNNSTIDHQNNIIPSTAVIQQQQQQQQKTTNKNQNNQNISSTSLVQVPSNDHHLNDQQIQNSNKIKGNNSNEDNDEDGQNERQQMILPVDQANQQQQQDRFDNNNLQSSSIMIANDNQSSQSFHSIQQEGKLQSENEQEEQEQEEQEEQEEEEDRQQDKQENIQQEENVKNKPFNKKDSKRIKIEQKHREYNKNNQGKRNDNNDHRRTDVSSLSNVIKFKKVFQQIQNRNSSSNDSNTQSHLKSTPFDASNVPWMNARTKSNKNCLLRLHNQMIDFYLYFSEEEKRHQQILSHFRKLQAKVFRKFQNCEIMAPFLMNKVYLKNTQNQIFLVLDNLNKSNQNSIIQQCEQCLRQCNFQHIRLHSEQPAKDYPRKQHKLFFTCSTTCNNSQMKQQYDQNGPTKVKTEENPQKKKQNVPQEYSPSLFPQLSTSLSQIRFSVKLVSSEWVSYLTLMNQTLENNLESKYLFFVFYCIILQRGYQNVVKSYMLFGLIAVFIHERRKQKSRSLTQNLLKFLEYYGIGPFTERKIVHLNKEQFQIKIDTQAVHLSQSIPNFCLFSFWISENIDISHPMIRQFFSLLKNRYRLLSNYNFWETESVLSALVYPNETQQFSY